MTVVYEEQTVQGVVKLKVSELLTASPVYEYFEKQKAEFVEYLLSIKEMFARDHTTYQDEISILWAEIDNKPVGSICFSKVDVSKRLMSLNFIDAETDSVRKIMYQYFERMSKELNCVEISHRVSLKDHKSMEQLEQLGFTMEFYLLFKRVGANGKT
jgi:hypothetical protein